MNRKISVGLALSLVAIVATIAITLTYSIAMNTFESRMSAITERQMTNDLLTEIDSKIRQKYSGYVSEDSVRTGLASGYIDGLEDEFCEYFTAEEWDLEVSRQAGHDFGLGINVSRSSSGNIQINRVNSGSPAAKAGLKKGDVITRIGGTTVLAIGYDNALRMISGSNTAVAVTVEGKNPLELTKTQFDTVSVEYRTIGELGCISINQFNATTPAQFNSALNKLRQNDAEGIIIDLRGSEGGSYQHACDILDTLLPACRLMITTDKTGTQKVLYMSDADSLDLPMCVLINENTKGAAELFASAMSDCGVRLVGTPTYGQLTVQEDFELSDGSALRLTTCSWSTTTGRSVADGVIVPDENIELSDYQQSNLYLLAPEDDPHIMRAADIIRKAIEEGNSSPVSPETAATTQPEE